MRKLLVFAFSILVLLALAGVVAAASDEDAGCGSCGCTAGGDELYSIMHVDLKTVREWQEEIDAEPVATVVKPKVLSRFTTAQVTDSFSILDHVNYVPGDRNQGSCGNCWVWAGTGVMEIAHDVNYGVDDRLSIQFLDSNLNGGGPNGFACCGGGLGGFADFYEPVSGQGFAIPWSNTNGNFVDGSHCCNNPPGCVAPRDSAGTAAATISTTPRYGISSIAAEQITTHQAGQGTAIQNVKNILDAHRGIYYSWCLADSADWDDFQVDFWRLQNEDDLWDPAPYAQHTWVNGQGGCHAVLVVGYDTDPVRGDYWLILNSWGTNANRTHGLFKMTQNLDYDEWYWGTDNNGNPAKYYLMNWQTLKVEFDNHAPTAEANGPYTGTEGSKVTFDATGSSDADAGTTLQYRWDVNNDGSYEVGPVTTPKVDYTYCDDYSGPVKLEVSDGHANGPLTATDTAEVTVSEVVATVDAGTDQDVNEGDTVSFGGTVTDPATCETRTIGWDFGDGHTASGTLTPEHVFCPDGTYIVTLTVTDDGTPVTDTLMVKVENVAPVAEAGGNLQADEGATVLFHGTATNGGAACDTLTYEWDFGDGSTATGADPAHEYGHEGMFTATLTVSDGELEGIDTLTVTVKNVDPAATIVSMDQPNDEFILPGQTLDFSGRFTDPGWIDTHSASWDFGDGTVLAGTMNEENGKPDSTGTTTASHPYIAPGTFTVTLTVTDDGSGDGTATTQVMVFTAHEALLVMNGYIQGLPGSDFAGPAPQRKNALNNMIGAIDGMIAKGDFRGAIQDLRNNLLEKADGSCGGKANNDWITGATAQSHICQKIDDLTAYLATL